MVNIKFLLVLNIIFIFFSAFVFLIGNKPFLFFYFPLILLFILIMVKSPREFIINVNNLYKKTPLKYYFYFIIYLLLSSFILYLNGKTNILIFYYIFIKLFPIFLLCYLLSSIFIPKYLSIKTTIKILLLILFFGFIWGLLGFLGELYDITFLKNMIDTLSNMKQLTQNVEIMTDTISGIPRLRSFCHEPGSFATLIFLFLPIIYKLSLQKEKIFQNKYVNYLIKKSLIPLAWLCLILTMSPIYLIFSSIITIIYFFRYIINFIYKYYYVIFTMLIIILLTILLFFFIDKNLIFKFIEKTYILRILNVLNNIDDFSSLIVIEGSLGSRIVSFINSFILGLKSPLIGLGYDNVRFYMFDQFLNSPVPLTQENIQNMQYDIISNSGTAYNKSLFFGLFAETGIIGVFLYYLFLFKNIITIKRIKHYFNGTYYNFLCALEYFTCMLIIFSFYIPSMNITYVCFLLGLTNSFTILVKNKFTTLEKTR